MLVGYLLKAKKDLQIYKFKDLLKQFKETRDSRYIFRNGLDKAWCQLDMAYGDLKDLAKISHKVLCDEAFIIKNNPKYDGYHCGLV